MRLIRLREVFHEVFPQTLFPFLFLSRFPSLCCLIASWGVQLWVLDGSIAMVRTKEALERVGIPVKCRGK